MDLPTVIWNPPHPKTCSCRRYQACQSHTGPTPSLSFLPHRSLRCLWELWDLRDLRCLRWFWRLRHFHLQQWRSQRQQESMKRETKGAWIDEEQKTMEDPRRNPTQCFILFLWIQLFDFVLLSDRGSTTPGKQSHCSQGVSHYSAVHGMLLFLPSLTTPWIACFFGAGIARKKSWDIPLHHRPNFGEVKNSVALGWWSWSCPSWALFLNTITTMPWLETRDIAGFGHCVQFPQI